MIDVFYRLKALSQSGVRIHLHCYTYGRRPAPELEALCAEVHYYRRETLPHHLLSHRPYIVSSRCSKALLHRLMQDDYPILLEGLHNGWLLEHLDSSHRLVMVRAHNVEHDYYARLAAVERRLFRRAYLRMDARKLERYEPILTRASAVLAITETDAAHFRQMGCRRVLHVPASHPMDEIVSQQGRGDYALFHGDLSVAENIDAVRFLAERIFLPNGPHQLLCAGRNPDPTLRQFKHIRIIANPTDGEMERLIREAQVNILFTQQATGLKLKLLHSLFSGRHCLVNPLMVQGTGLQEACHVADGAEEMRQQLNTLMQSPFSEVDVQRRRQLLGHQYSNQSNAQTIIDEITLHSFSADQSLPQHRR